MLSGLYYLLTAAHEESSRSLSFIPSRSMCRLSFYRVEFFFTEWERKILVRLFPFCLKVCIKFDRSFDHSPSPSLIKSLTSPRCKIIFVQTSIFVGYSSNLFDSKSSKLRAPQFLNHGRYGKTEEATNIRFHEG